MSRRAALLVVLLVSALPLFGASYRVTMLLYPGDDAAAVARRLAATYRGEIRTPVDAERAFTVEMSESTAELLARDPQLRSISAQDEQIVTNAGTTTWSLGTYDYDGSGNIKNIDRAGSLAADHDVFVYDTRNRLASGRVNGKTQSVEYDEFGNITKLTTGTDVANLGVNTESNRIDLTVDPSGSPALGATYDGNGNVTSYLQDTFQYDGLNVMPLDPQPLMVRRRSSGVRVKR